MKINKIHHIAIICSNYQKSKAFYVNILGFEIIAETLIGIKEELNIIANCQKLGITREL